MLELRFESLNKSEIREYLEKSRYAFASLNDEQFVSDYSEKLSRYSEFIVGRDESGNIGCLIAFYANHAPVIFLSHVHTFKAHLRHGYLRDMLNLIVERKKGEGFLYIDLEVNKDNYPAVSAYQRLGFKTTGEKDKKYLMRLTIE